MSLKIKLLNHNKIMNIVIRNFFQNLNFRYLYAYTNALCLSILNIFTYLFKLCMVFIWYLSCIEFTKFFDLAKKEKKY